MQTNTDTKASCFELDISGSDDAQQEPEIERQQGGKEIAFHTLVNQCSGLLVRMVKMTESVGVVMRAKSGERSCWCVAQSSPNGRRRRSGRISCIVSLVSCQVPSTLSSTRINVSTKLDLQLPLVCRLVVCVD